MVRLTSRSFLHLTPEVVEFEAEHPFYAKVLQLDSEEVTFRSLEGGEGKLDRAVAEDHVVRASEVSQAGQISLLRRPVSVSLAGEVQYGQVTSVDQSSVTIRSGGHEFVAAAAAVSVVPPVIVLLLEDVEFRSDEWSPTDLEAMEQSILSRLLGTGGSSASNQVSEILEGLMSEENHPSGDKVCQWIDPRTGEEAHFPLQHAINLAFYVDGGVSPVPRSVGNSFCIPPTPQPLRSTSALSRGSVQDVEELFDTFPDDDDSPQDESERGAEVGRANTTTQHVTKRQQEITVANGDDGHVPSKRQRVQTAIDQDALIIAKISDEPDLLERFVMIRKEANVKAQPAEGGGTMRTHVQKPSPTTRGKKSSKYAFAPSDEQELVHERITTEKHKGKSANVFCRGLVRSEHVEFNAVPGICTRAYDIRFGSGGLSIRQFARLSRNERVAWLEAGGSNFDNLSATAEFSAASPASRIDDVVDSARVFLTYAREFCCAELVELVETIVKFTEHTLSQVSWTPKEISSLVFWVNDVLEDFRTAAEEGGALRAVQQRCTTDDRLLKDVMFIKVHRQVQDVRHEMMSGPARLEGHDEQGSQLRNGRNHDGKKRFGRIHQEVLRKLPVQNDPASGKSRRLCMRFLSAAGCAVDSDGGCPSEHGHFVPNSYPRS